MDYLYTPQDIYDKTNNGLSIFESYISDLKMKTPTKSEAFKMRTGERTASASLFLCSKSKIWKCKDFGSGEVLSPIEYKMAQDFLEFGEAIKELANGLGIKGAKPTPPATDVVFLDPEPTDKVGDYHILTAPMPESALKTLGAHVTKQVCETYNLSYAESITTVIKTKTGKLKKIVKKSTDTYPIFVYKYATWAKVYEPKSEKFRFSYLGTKPTRHVFGMSQLKKQVDVIRTQNKKEVDDPATLKAESVFIVTGGSDALNVASLNDNYNVIWFNSESEIINGYEYNELQDLAHNIYYLGDLDSTGVTQALKVGFNFLDIRLIWLPETLKQRKSPNGKPLKDVKDFINKICDTTNLKATQSAFKNIVYSANPLKFWDTYKYQKQTKYRINSVHLFHYLKCCGFYKLKDESAKLGFSFIHITDNRVKKVDEFYIKDHVNKFLETTHQHKQVRNLIHDSPKFNSKQLSELTFSEIDFNNADKQTQYLFFDNFTYKITANNIEQLPNNKVDRMVLEDKVINHKVTPTKPHFKITANDPENARIEVLRNDNPFFNYLINTSRLHWQKELIKPYKDNPKAGEAYRALNKFNISGSNLDKLDQEEQQQNLCNKIYGLGYMLHNYKDLSNSVVVYAMDNKISELDESHGGSGKSLTWINAIKEVSKSVVDIDGRNTEAVKDKHALGAVTKDTDHLLIDDLGYSFDFNILYNAVTSSMLVNPKFNQQYSIPFKDSPKIVCTSNYQLKRLDPSTLRRVLFVVYSDFYHAKSDEYRTAHKVSDDFNGNNLFQDFTEQEYNLFYNFIFECIQFYLSHPKAIETPMENVLKRGLLRNIGDNFLEWADTFFTNTDDDYLNNFNKDLGRTDVYEHHKQHAGKQAKNSRNFISSLSDWCKLRGFEFQPTDIIPINADGRQIKKKKINGKTQDVIYIHNTKAHNFNKPQTDTNTEDLPF